MSKKVDMNEMTLQQAIDSELVVLKESVSDMISEALKEKEAELMKEAEKKFNKKKAKDNKIMREKEVSTYLNGSLITDLDFGKKLMQMNVPPHLLKNLRDDHSKLSRDKIWEFIRNS